MTTVGGGVADVTIISDESASDSEQEVFSQSQVTDTTRLLQDSEKSKVTSPKHVRYADDGNNNGWKQKGAKLLGMRPESMDMELESQWPTASSALLPAELKETEARLQGCRNVWRRLLLVCVVTMLLMVGLPLQSPSLLVLNITDPQTQVITLGCLYGSIALSSLTAVFIIKILDVRLSVLVGCVGVSVYTCAKFDASIYITVPGSVIAGLCIGPCLCALWTYITLLAKEYSIFAEKDFKKSLLLFSGMFHTWCLGALFFTQVFHMVVLPFPWKPSQSKQDREVGTTATVDYSTLNTSEVYDNTTLHIPSTTSYVSGPSSTMAMLVSCGPDYCWQDFLNAFTWIQDTSSAFYIFRIQALLGCYLVCSLGALVLAVVVIDTSTPVTTAEVQEYDTLRSRVNAQHMWHTLAMIVQSDTLLILPAMVYVGTEQLIGYSVFIQAFASCDLDPGLGALVLLCAASIPLVLCGPLGLLIGWMGRLKAVLPAAILHAALLILYLAWPSSIRGVATQFVVTFLWVAGDCVWQVVITTLLGHTFPSQLEGTMAYYGLWRTLGAMIVYACQALALCSKLLLGFSIILLLLAALLYVAMEIRVRLREQECRNGKDQNLVMPGLDGATWLPNINPMHVRKERTTALLNRVPGVVSLDLVST